MGRDGPSARDIVDGYMNQKGLSLRAKREIYESLASAQPCSATLHESMCKHPQICRLACCITQGNQTARHDECNPFIGSCRADQQMADS